MAYIALTSYAPSQGKMAEAVSILKEGMDLLRSHGARGYVAQVSRGGVPGTLNILSEYTDVVAFGAAVDAGNADPKVASFMAQANAAMALTPIRSVDYMELPGLETPFEAIERCTCVQATVFHIQRGKQAQSLERIQRSKALMEKHGAKVRAMNSVASDPFGLTSVVSYYENFTARGHAAVSLGADPEWSAYVAEINGDTASSDFLRTIVMRVL